MMSSRLLGKYNKMVNAASEVGVPKDIKCSETLNLLEKWVQDGVLSKEAYNDFKQLVHSNEISCVEIEEEYTPTVPISNVQELFIVLNKIISLEAERKSNEIFKEKFRNWCKEVGGEYSEGELFGTTQMSCIFPEEKDVTLSGDYRTFNDITKVSISARKVATPEEPYAIYTPPIVFEANVLDRDVEIEGKGSAIITLPTDASLNGIAKTGVGVIIGKETVKITFR